MNVTDVFRKIHTARRLSPGERARVLRARLSLPPARPVYVFEQDNLAVTAGHNPAWRTDPRFQRAYKLGRATQSWGAAEVEYRCYTACWAAVQGLAIKGDFVECGVNRGGLSRAIIEYVDFAAQRDRHFYLLDTYCGFPDQFAGTAAPSIPDGYYSECYEDVRQTFALFPNVTLIRGTVPDTLSQVPSERVAYLSLDMNSAEPEIAAITHFWPRLSAGAIVVLDDYGATGYERQKTAMDEFALEQGIAVLTLPTGQGLIVKP